MLYKTLSEFYEKLEATTKKLEKRDILSDLYKQLDKTDLEMVVLLSMGIVFPGKEAELGIAEKLMERIIQKTYGIDPKSYNKIFRKTGDAGLTAEFFAEQRKQITLAKKNLTTDKVFENLKKLPYETGAKSQDRKISLISELLGQASGKEAKYMVRTVLGEMRFGVAEGIVRDAIAKAFDAEPKQVEEAYNILTNFGRVALMARENKLSKIKIELFNPIRVMLAENAESLEQALTKIPEPICEWKYDGFRVAVHKDGDKVKIFSRRMDDVTNQFPDIAELSRNCLPDKCIVEGEVLAVDKNNNPQPFQMLSRRIQRKYDIEEMVRKIQVQVNLFDILFLNDENYMNKKLRERRKVLEDKVKKIPNRFQLTNAIMSNDIKKVREFYNQSLKAGQEGLMIKNLDGEYKPGKRVDSWYKVKPTLETLELVITQAQWGEGKRAKWLSSFVLSCRDPETGDFLQIGKMGTGLTDEQFEELTKKLKKLIISEERGMLIIKPTIVVEVDYQEIQRSPKYKSGFALRFPRLKKIRYDRSAVDIDNIARVEKIYKQQRK